MNYFSEIMNLRDKLHKVIVHTAVSTYNPYDLTLELNNPITFVRLVDDIPVKFTVTGVNSSTGYLMGNGHIIDYQYVPLEILSEIYNSLDRKEFSLNPELFV
jgi:hypothetical protein